MVSFNFATAQRILFGSGRFAEIGALVAEFGRRACVLTGEHSLERAGRLEDLERQFREAGVEWERVTIGGEPTVERVDEATGRARAFQAEVVVSIGGGSVIDAGKAIAALLANGGEAIDYLEGVGRGRVLSRPSVPFIAVPTTAGTGSEATKNAVIGNEARTFKKSMRSEWMLPSVALVDPELTFDCPPAVTAACGMDALTQLLEAFTSKKANPMIDALAGLGLGLASRLPKAVQDPHDASAREAMAMASLLGGISLANAGLGAVHGLASPLGAAYPIPHGQICAMLLPAVVLINARKANRIGNQWLLQKYGAAAIQIISLREENHRPGEIPPEELLSEEELENNSLVVAVALSEYLRELNGRFGIPGLSHYGIGKKEFPAIIAGGRGSSMQTNPVELSDEDLEQILSLAL